MKEIDPKKVKIFLASPEPWEQCIVSVEDDKILWFILSDEKLNGECIVELPGDGENIMRRIPLKLFRTLLDAAERKLLGNPRNEAQ
ncbi:MAG: hypothetical protein FLDDKLPJ_03628 [Phycisphaerae bacterium]|nr:hypothetical protein [Phycisphaerae bacterium]